MNVLIYLRKSREDAEKEKRTGEDILAVHRGRLVSLCEQSGHSYVIKEEIVSGDTIAGRPVFQEVLYKLIPSGNYHAVAVNEISRLGRGNMRDAGVIYESIIEYNILIITPHKIYNPSNRSDLRQIRFELFLSREEYEMIKDRLLDGKDAAARAGRAVGYIGTLGVKNIRGKYVTDKEGLKIAELVFNLVREGKQLKVITEYLNELGCKTGRNNKWTTSSIKQVVKNIHYEGFQNWRGEIIKAQHGPLLPLELIYEARAKLESVDTRSTVKNQMFWVPLYCAVCGKRMYGDNRKPRQGNKVYNYPVYFCYGKWDNPRCNNRIRMETIHAKVYEGLWTIINDKSVQNSLIAQMLSKNLTSGKEEVEFLKEEMRNKEIRFAQIRGDYITGIVDAGIYNEAKETLGNQIKAIQTRIRKLEPKTKQKAKSPTDIIKRLHKSLQQWDSLADSTKAEVVREYTEKITYNRAEKLFKIMLRLPL